MFNRYCGLQASFDLKKKLSEVGRPHYFFHWLQVLLRPGLYGNFKALHLCHSSVKCQPISVVELCLANTFSFRKLAVGGAWCYRDIDYRLASVKC